MHAFNLHSKLQIKGQEPEFLPLMIEYHVYVETRLDRAQLFSSRLPSANYRRSEACRVSRGCMQRLGSSGENPEVGPALWKKRKKREKGRSRRVGGKEGEEGVSPEVVVAGVGQGMAGGGGGVSRPEKRERGG